MKIKIIKCLTDNYSYIIFNEKTLSAAVIDPSEADPIINQIEQNKLVLKYIFNTHHHYDHVGGNQKLKEKYSCKVVGFEKDKHRIPDIDIGLKDNEKWKNELFECEVKHIPGHTSGHICIYIKKLNALFTGDTLFSLGCGRIFEGTYKEMYDSLNMLKRFPNDTKIYCGHEYTKNNLGFCIKFNPNNKYLKDKEKMLEAKIKEGKPTIPSTIKEEIQTNIFLRYNDVDVKDALNLKNASDLEIFTKLRDLKDNF